MEEQIEVIYHIRLFSKKGKPKPVPQQSLNLQDAETTSFNYKRSRKPDYKILKSVYQILTNFCLFRMMVMYMTQRKIEQTIQNRIVRRWFILMDLQIFNFLQMSDQVFVLISSPILNKIDDFQRFFKSNWQALQSTLKGRLAWVNFINNNFLIFFNPLFKPINYILYNIIHIWFNEKKVHQTDIEIVNVGLLLFQLKYFIIARFIHYLFKIVLAPVYYMRHVNQVIDDKLNGYIELTLEDVFVVFKESFYFLWLEIIFQISL